MHETHLAAIDADVWPNLATIPSGHFSSARARVAEAHFARACTHAGLELDSSNEADLIIDHEGLFYRLAQFGWVGLIESYLAGEWRTPDSDGLVNVLTRLLSTGFSPRSAPKLAPAPFDGGQIPAALTRLYSGDKTSGFGGIFSSGVPTTVRTAVDSYVSGGLRAGERRQHFVDITTVAEPRSVQREDFQDAQYRAASELLEDLGVSASSHVLEFPSNGSVLAETAAKRHALVDSISRDQAHLKAVREDLILAGVEDFVHLHAVDNPLPTKQDWQGRYDAVASLEAWENFTTRDREYFLRRAHQLLRPGGKLGIQTIVATEGLTSPARNALLALRAYIWPGLNYLTINEHHRLFDRKSALRIIKQTHFSSHYQLSLQLQRSFFEGHLREAAAAGFDAVYRRLWVFQLALRETLLSLGMCDAVQLIATQRDRHGRR